MRSYIGVMYQQHQWFALLFHVTLPDAACNCCFFHSAIAVLAIYDVRNNSFTWPFFCPIEFKIPH